MDAKKEGKQSATTMAADAVRSFSRLGLEMFRLPIAVAAAVTGTSLSKAKASPQHKQRAKRHHAAGHKIHQMSREEEARSRHAA